MTIDERLVEKLVGEQFPQWAHLLIKLVEPGGWDNRTFRLGEEMLVRLPSAERYAAKVEQEQYWLPKLAPFLSLSIPSPIAMGNPSEDYPWHWSIYRWIEGEPAATGEIKNLDEFAVSLAEFLGTLQQIDTNAELPPGLHNFHRGGSLEVYDSETREALSSLKGSIDTDVATTIWEAALASVWEKSPEWIHGDVSAENLLVKDGHLAAVIDFGGLATGDPSCDLVIAWTFFEGSSREAFKTAMAVDNSTWERARGWALWKAAITLMEEKDSGSLKAKKAERVIKALIAEHSA
jgi:aminoglycoside phosphotransferase (APT) family kinase protein